MRKKVSFETEKKRSTGTRKKFTVFFICAVVLLLGVSCTVILVKNNFDIHAAVGGDIVATSEEDEETSAVIGDATKNYLLWCSNTQTGQLDFLWLVKAEFPGKDLLICSVSPSEILTYNEQNMTVASVFSGYNSNGLIAALSETYGIEIDSYMGSNTESFKQMVNMFGSVTVDLDRAIEYRGSFNLILPKGENALKGDTVYKYLVYLSTDIENGLEKRSRVLENILNVAFLEKYSGRTDKIFTKMSNAVTTDITIVKYSASRDLIINAFREGLGEIDITNNIEDMK